MNNILPKEKLAKINFEHIRKREYFYVFSPYFILYLFDQIFNELKFYSIYIRIFFIEKKLRKYALNIKKNGYLILKSGYLYPNIELSEIISECEKAKEKVENKLIMKGSIRYKRLENYSNLIKKLTTNKRWINLNYLYTSEKTVPVTMLSETTKIEREENTEIFADYPHFDIYKHQLKFVIALKDVDENNGPTEILPKTSSYKFSAFISYFSSWLALKKIIKDSKPFLSERFIKNIYKKNKSLNITLKKGDLLIFDTRNFHRATEITSGKRELLWFYF